MQDTALYRLDGSSTKGMTSSVTATMRSPKVVVITFRWRMVSSYNPDKFSSLQHEHTMASPFSDSSQIEEASFVPDGSVFGNPLYLAKSGEFWIVHRGLRGNCNQERVTARRQMTIYRLFRELRNSQHLAAFGSSRARVAALGLLKPIIAHLLQLSDIRGTTSNRSTSSRSRV